MKTLYEALFVSYGAICCIHASAVAVFVEWWIVVFVDNVSFHRGICTLGASLCLGGRSHGAYSNRGVSHSVIMPRCGRSHEAYSSRGVILSFIHSFCQSVATISRSSLKTNR